MRCGRLALPNFQVYYWAVILVSVRLWFVRSRANAAVCLEAALLGSLGDLGNLVYRDSGAYADLPPRTRTTPKVWVVARKRFRKQNAWSPFQPLWGNPSLPHFTIPDPQVWTKYGLKALRDIMPTGMLLTYKDLSTKFNLPLMDVFSLLPTASCS